MSDSATVSRAQLVYGLCLPLAALIGFFLADPLQSSTIVVLGVVLAVLVWPLFARWHHPLLIVSLHSVFILSFLPGNLPLWMFVAAGGLLIVVFRRCIDPHVQVFPPGGVPWALLALGFVIAVTALARGGIGLKALGSEMMGGKKYIYLILSIAAYFVLVSKPVPRQHAMLYVGLFLLSGLTTLVSHLVYSAGGNFYWLFSIIDRGPALGQAMAEWDVRGVTLFRSVSMMTAASAVITFLLARHGLKELFNLKRPWRLLLLVACLLGGMLGGFRSFLVGTALMIAVLFFLEGLHRTRYLAIAAALGMAGFGALAAFSDRLPSSIQRAISFLPVQIDEQVRRDAQGSLDWRFEMWAILRQEVPQYLALGKGYVIDPTAFQISGFNSHLGFGPRSEWAILAGDYHNGPLSVLIPLGVWGVLVFCWFLVAGAIRLAWFCRHGDRRLMTLNRALYAIFLTKIVFFAFFFGALESDLVEFVALIGLGECLNAARSPAEGGGTSAETAAIQATEGEDND